MDDFALSHKYTEREIAELDVRTIAAHWYRQRMDKLRRSYERLRATVLATRQHLIPSETFHFREYLWAYFAQRSRAFHVPLRGGAGVFLPAIDMFNHANLPQLGIRSFYQPGEDSWLIVERPVKRGEQLFVSYGQQTNFHWLGAHGFTIPPVQLRLTLVSIS